jgi:phage protein D
MTTFTAIETLGAFHVPEFDIRLDGADAGARLKYDVLDVSYSDDTDALDSFEFSLVDWDPTTFEPVYSSPWDAAGAIKTYNTADGQKPIPVLAPGTPVSLYLSYKDHGDDPLLMLRGNVVSLSTSFPATGVPTARVRVLNPLADYEKKKLTGNATGGAIDVISEIATQLEIGFDDSAVPADIKAAEKGQLEPILALSELNPVEHIRKMARSMGLNARLVQDEAGEDVLTLAPEEAVAYALTWGRTLLSFTPTISTKSLVSRVTVRAQNPMGGSPEEQKVEGSASWDDLPNLDRASVGPGALDEIIAGLGDTEEVIDKPSREQNTTPDQAALNRMRELAADLLKGSGQTVGLPHLRAGSRVEISGVGARFGGIYEVTKSTHAIGASGYTTSFEARKEIFND